MGSTESSLWSPAKGGIAAPSGFSASGISAGLKNSGNFDLALLLAPKGAVCAGTFTQSLVRAACVDLCRERLLINQGKARAVLINSGQANACTGTHGLLDALQASSSLSKELGFKTDEILVCSTGVIGQRIPMKNLLSGIPPLVANLNEQDGTNAANAILTTDLTSKQIALQAFLGDRCITIGGMAKGSGMIHPDMATMLGFITCDAGVPIQIWNEMVRQVVDDSF